jgi:hypothetical protein
LALEEMLVKVETMAEPTQQMVVNHLSQQLACSVAVPVVREIKLQQMAQAVVVRDMTVHLSHQHVVELEQSAKEITELLVQSLDMAAAAEAAVQEAPAETQFFLTSAVTVVTVSSARSPEAMSTTAVAVAEVLTQTMGSTADYAPAPIIITVTAPIQTLR